MAEFPAMPLLTDAYLGDTRHLTAAQHGAYLLLLITAWRMPDCALPDNDEILCRCAAMSKREWLKNKEVVLAFWNLGDDHKLRQSNQLKVRKKVSVNQQQKHQAGVASSLKRKETTPTVVEVTLQRSDHGNPTSQSQKLNNLDSQPVALTSAREKAGLAPDEICQEEILPNIWQDYAEAKNIPNEQIFKSWRKFKETTEFPFRLSRWRAWIDRERITGRAA